MPDILSINRLSCKIVLIIFSLIVFCENTHADEGKNVLILNSGNSRDYTSNALVYAIRTHFTAFAPFTNFFIEDLNFEAFPDEHYNKILEDFLSKKYKKQSFNAVLTIENEALNFAVRYRKHLFRDIPIVFCGAGINYQEIIKDQKDITGVISEADLKAKITLALNLHPDRPDIIILSDSSLVSKSSLFKIKKAVPAISADINITYLQNIAHSDILRILQPVEKKSILFLAGSTFNETGKLTDAEDLNTLINSKVNIPVYRFWRRTLHNISGSFADIGLPGKMAAETVISLLDGKSISEFPVRVIKDPPYTFNYHELTRFGVDLNKLPPNSKLEGKPQPFIEKYQSEIFFIIEGIIATLIICILLFNIYKRKKIENALKESEERFKGVYENVPIGIYRTTPDGKILMANPALVKTLGYDSIEEITQINLNDDHKKAGYRRDLFKQDIEKNGFVKNYQDTWVKRNGELIYLTENARVIKDSRGYPLYYEGIIEDVTEKKKAENELRHYILELQRNKEIIENDARILEELNQTLAKSEKQLIELNQSKDKFFSIISHDLRSPFNSLIGFTDLLIKNFDDFSTDEIKGISRNIHSSLTHLYELIENILQWSGLQTGKFPHNPEIINIARIVDQVTELLNGSALKKSITLTSSVPDKLFVFSDRLMLFSVLQNLISNALKFTNPGGEIRINSEDEHLFYKIIVEDNGIGMKPDEVEQIFKLDSSLSRSGTSGEKGTGLGLILCKELTEKNGGEISVESVYGLGTRFTFTVPKFIE